MKKVGMTPVMDSQLNNFVKKKVVSTFAPVNNNNNNSGTMPGISEGLNSHSTSPKYPNNILDPGVGGPRFQNDLQSNY
jgi:hypothetical protein